MATVPSPGYSPTTILEQETALQSEALLVPIPFTLLHHRLCHCGGHRDCRPDPDQQKHQHEQLSRESLISIIQFSVKKQRINSYNRRPAKPDDFHC